MPFGFDYFRIVFMPRIKRKLKNIFGKIFKQKKAVEKMNPKKNQDLLAKIAQTDTSEWARVEAVKKLYPKENQEVLAAIARNDESINVKKTVIKKLDSKKWGDLIFEVSTKIADKICPICEILLIKKNRDIPKIVLLVKEGLTAGLKTAGLAEKQAKEAINAFAYKCRKCGSLQCKKCSEKMPCSRCGNNVFDMALD